MKTLIETLKVIVWSVIIVAWVCALCAVYLVESSTYYVG